MNPSDVWFLGKGKFRNAVFQRCYEILPRTDEPEQPVPRFRFLVCWWHECALFFFLRGQYIKEFCFLVYECRLSHLCFFKLCLQIGDLVVLERENL